MARNNSYINIFGTLKFNNTPLKYYNVDIDILDCHSAGDNSDDKGRLWFKNVPICAIEKSYNLAIHDNIKEIDSDSYYGKAIPADGNIGIIIVSTESARQLMPVAQEETVSIIENSIMELIEKDELESIHPANIKELLIKKIEYHFSNRKIRPGQSTDILIKEYTEKVLSKKDLQNNRIILALSLLIHGEFEQALEQIDSEATLTEYALRKSIAEEIYNYNQVTLLQNKTLTEYRWSNMINQELGNPDMEKAGEAKILELKNLDLK